MTPLERSPAASLTSGPRFLLACHFLVALLVAAEAFAGGAIGVSSVHAGFFSNEPLAGLEPAAGDLFAFALAAGDFNGDGADDLAAGIPRDDGVTGFEVIDCGGATVRYGVPGLGLGGTFDFLSQRSDPLENDEPDDQFGHAIAAGDFNGDGRDDLAVGVPWNGPFDTGGFGVHFGMSGGVQQVAEQHVDWDGIVRPPTPPGIQPYSIGLALAAGDFNGDGIQDLAAGGHLDGIFAPNPEPRANVGSVLVTEGHIGGFVPFHGYLITQLDEEIADEAETNDYFGLALATGDFNGDSFDDLAIGVPGEDGTGAVQLLYGSEFGLLYATDLIHRQGEAGGGGLAESGDDFGAALASGDFDGDGFDDLAVGAPLEDEGSGMFAVPDTGAISVLYGSAAGFNLARTDYLLQSSIYGVTSADRPFDVFGFALTAGDFDGDGRDDLAVGHHGEDGDGAGRGAVTVLMGAPGGFLDRYGRLLAGVHGTPGVEQDTQGFGRALTAGDFDGNGFSDLAVGVPYFNAPGLIDTGAAIVLYGALFADGFEVQNTSFWSGVAP